MRFGRLAGILNVAGEKPPGIAGRGLNRDDPVWVGDPSLPPEGQVPDDAGLTV